jgi:hypothetical protein
MFDRDLVTSGFDCETLISEKYLRYLLLAQIEAGLLPLEFDFVDTTSGLSYTVKLHPPIDEDYQRLYTPSPDAPLPARGSLGLAQDFREPASAIAFATSPGLFALLGPDAKVQRAERAPGSSDFRFPLREDLSDPESDEIGEIGQHQRGAQAQRPSGSAASDGAGRGKRGRDVHGLVAGRRRHGSVLLQSEARRRRHRRVEIRRRCRYGLARHAGVLRRRDCSSAFSASRFAA